MAHLSTLTCLWSITTTYELTTLMSFLALVIMLLKSLGSSYKLGFQRPCLRPSMRHQHGVSTQSLINLGKTFFRISRIWIIGQTWCLARLFVYLTSLISQILDSLYWLHGSVAFLFLMVWQWKHRIVISSQWEWGGGGGGGWWGYFLKRCWWGCAAGWSPIFTTGLTIMRSHFQSELLELGCIFSDFLGKRVLVFIFTVCKRTRMVLL